MASTNFFHVGFFVIASVLLGCACIEDSESEDATPTSQEALIQGDWLLIKTEGGYQYVDPNPEPPAVVIYKFRRETFEVYVNDILERSGTFKIGERSESLNDGALRFKITFRDQYESTELVLVEGSTMIIEFGQIAADGVVMYFERVTG